jgi:N-acetylneuraminic acid mutarotase/predicted MFS family arabinose efflux permease
MKNPFSSTYARAWIIVGILWGIAMLNYLDRLMLTTMGDSIKVATWEKMAPLPEPLGVAGPCAGVSGEALLVGGGANFPAGKPWEGGKKAWTDKVYALEQPDGTWLEAGRLPRPLAYGVSATVPGGIACVGGNDAEGPRAEAFLLKWDAKSRKLATDPLPSLPRPLTNACGAAIGTRLFVAGGEETANATTATAALLMLDLAAPDKGWQELPPCPGPARILAGAAVTNGRFYLAGGATLGTGPDGKPKRGGYLKDAWSFDPEKQLWSQLADLPRPLAAMPSPGASANPGEFIFYGGDDGAEQALPPEKRTGFWRGVVRYEAGKNAWMVVGEMPNAARVTVPLVLWQGRFVIPSGEVKAGTRSAEISHPMTNAHFGLLTSIFLWVYAFCSPFGGYLADRFSRSRVIIGSLLIWSVVTWLTGHTHSFSQLLCARAIMGISEAFYIPAALALIADYHRGPTRSLATGVHMSGLYAGAAMGGLGGVVADMFGWRSSFTLFGFVGIAYAILIFWPLRDAPPAAPAATAAQPKKGEVRLLPALWALISTPSFLVLLGYNSLLALAFWGINGWLPTYLKDHFKLGQGAAGMNATFYIQFASFIGILVGGFVADRWCRTNVRGRIFIPAIGFIAAAPCLFLAASTDVLPVAIAGLIVFGIARGFSDANLMPILCQVADSRYRATGYGILNFVGCVTGGLMIYVSGILKDAKVDLGNVFKVAAIGLLLAGLIILLVKPRREAESA